MVNMTNDPPLARDEVLALHRSHVWPPYTAIDDPRVPLVLDGASGARVHTSDGRALLDGNSSWWVAGLGHQHPRLVRALVGQAERFCHVTMAGATHEPAAALARDLAAVAPPGLTRAFFSDDGSTAVEAALKLAVQYCRQTGRPRKTRFVAFDGAYHGDTLGCVSLGGVPLFRQSFGALCFDVLRVASPADGDDDAAWSRAFDALAALVEKEHEEIAGVVVEPLVQGSAGMRMYDARYLAAVRELTARHDVLLVDDEVFTGYGRTGPMWACEHAGVVPDLVCVGKCFSGGMLPMAATLCHERLTDGFRGGRERAFLHGHSFCGNPLGAAVAREVLAVFRDEDVLGQVRRKAPTLRAAVDEVARLPGARRPRALGMIAAVDLSAGGYLGGLGWRVYEEALARGAYLRPLGDTIYMTPPLNIPDADLAELCAIFVDAATAALASR